MPAIGRRNLRRWAVYFERTGTDSGGEPILAEPIETPARWEHVRRQMMDPQGGVIVTTSMVQVGRELADGSVVWEGRLADLDRTATDLKLFEVVAAEKTPTVRDRLGEGYLEYGLMRFRGSLPTVTP